MRVDERLERDGCRNEHHEHERRSTHGPHQDTCKRPVTASIPLE